MSPIHRHERMGHTDYNIALLHTLPLQNTSILCRQSPQLLPAIPVRRGEIRLTGLNHGSRIISMILAAAEKQVLRIVQARLGEECWNCCDICILINCLVYVSMDGIAFNRDLSWMVGWMI